MAAVGAAAVEENAEVLVCTHKDLVKVRAEHLDGVPIEAVTIEMQLLTGEEELAKQIERVVMSRDA